MQELIRNAWAGWLQYTGNGKYAVLLLGLLLWTGYLHCRGQAGDGTEGRSVLQRYTAVTVLLAVCPLTAAIWMLYQTRFYDYIWIWSAVPVTGFIAVEAAGWFVKLTEDKGKEAGRRLCGAVLCSLALLWLCGSMGESKVSGMWTAANRRIAESPLGTHGDWEKQDGIWREGSEWTASMQEWCVWAPAQELAHIREQNGSIRLLYGRNMWEGALNGYSYDTYDEDIISLYEWMEELAVPVDEGVALPEPEKDEAMQYLRMAIERGVNCIVLPGQQAAVSDWVAEAASEYQLQMTRQEQESMLLCLLTDSQQPQ